MTTFRYRSYSIHTLHGDQLQAFMVREGETIMLPDVVSSSYEEGKDILVERARAVVDADLKARAEPAMTETRP